MDPRPKVTKEVLCEESRFILANVLAEGRYGKQNRLADIRRICEGSISLAFTEYLGFLESSGYLMYDRANDALDVTAEGERVVAGERSNELTERAVAHFGGRKAEAAKRRPVPAGERTGGIEKVDPRDRTASGERLEKLDKSERAASVPPVSTAAAAAALAVAAGAAPQRGEAARGDRGEAMDRRYERQNIIGSGGIGTVYRARQVHLDRDVALKEIRELFSFFADDQRREIVRRFGEAMRAAARLSHPNIVAVHDVNLEREHPYVITDYEPAGSLRRLIALAEDIPVGLVVKYLVQILHGLRAAHAQGVPHRGLKPENVLVDLYGNARITDFGIARVVERDQAVIRQVYIGMGAVAYMAPELFTDPMGSGPQTDIYALGIIFYELLTRKLPGRRSPMPSTVNPVLPKAFDDIFDRMTRDERAERFTSADEILEEIYKADGIDKFLEPRSAVLFAKSPLSDLKFKEPPPKDPDMPVDPTAFSQAPGAAGAPPGGMVGNVPTGTQSGLGTTSPSAGTGVRHATGSTRRPLTYSSRLRDRGSE